MKPIVLFITYTMTEPSKAGGAFFRALRLAVGFYDRGWNPILCNYGPELDDPKVHEAQGKVRIIHRDRNIVGTNRRKAYRFFKSFNPDVVVFGEGPFQLMDVFYDGARMLKCPFVLLDQYYKRSLVGPRHDVDLFLLSGLKCFWKDDLELYPWEALVPPFIETITPQKELPIPTHLHELPWITFIAYDRPVLQKEAELAARISLNLSIKEINPMFITVSYDPLEAKQEMDKAGIPPGRTIHLPVQTDACTYGLMQASRVVIMSNGFLQIMDALALGVPAICIDRGLGITSLNIEDRFKPFVSIGEDITIQEEKLKQWLQTSPFPLELKEELASERDGIQTCINLIEKTIKHPPLLPGLLRKAIHLGLDINRFFIQRSLT
jgi:hypothetical protein